jgi:hypothetical protein
MSVTATTVPAIHLAPASVAANPLRLVRAPVADPPYDDELPPGAAMVDGTLALAFPPTGEPVSLRLVPPASVDDDFGPQPTARADLPDPRPWTRRLTQAVAEVLAGARPAGQLARYATLDVLEHLERSTGRLAQVSNRAAGPAAQAVARGAVMRPIVASVHVSEPADGVAEVCAVLDTGPRRRALALRLEGLDGRWRCTGLQFG